MSPLLQFIARVLLVVSGIYRVELSVSADSGTCNLHWHCSSKNVCCKTDISRVFRCRTQLDSLSSTRSCFGYYCTSRRDCNGLENGQELCCMSNKCVLCTEECVSHKDCGTSHSCCKGAWWERSECRQTCFNKLCADHTDCGINECCRNQRCRFCSDKGCDADFECLPSQQCCDQLFYPESKCRNQCSGQYCNSDKDCSLSAYCDSHICVERDKCLDHTNCSDGWFCCMTAWENEIGYCGKNCIGNSCMGDNDCALPGECCSANFKCKKCGASCRSSSDCFNGTVCCNRPSIGDNRCAVYCKEESCTKSSDCITPGMWCSNGICSDARRSCDHNSDCVMSNGEQYYCCTDMLSERKVCSLDCTGKSCISDHNCTGENECCNSSGSCVTAGCPRAFLWWMYGLIIAVLVVIVKIVVWCYCLKRKNRLNRRRLNAAQMQHLPENTVGNDRIEPSVAPPSYSPGNALVSSGTNIAGDLNIPPPPYSFDDQVASPELNNEPPPRYRVIQI